ncbi:hypothetical protein GDO78_004343 [Eleutherodactylus coqui]|uniref:Uncharacterized protein n=1 Tax=Eleutherodactylus coqui TaxID=57060 RepID=A0A8J6JZM0_ELECQ|nr:hypothetical protein GDO78_004343 [Eleutherodactylus coqui]
MAGSPVQEAHHESQAQSKDRRRDNDKPDEHMDHTYSVACDIIEYDVPYSALSPDIIVLRRKIRRLQRQAQRQKNRIKCMKQLIKKLKAAT